LNVLPHVASGEFFGDGTANERRRTDTAAEEDACDGVTAGEELRRLHEVLDDVVENRSRQVLTPKLACVPPVNKTTTTNQYQSINQSVFI